MNKYEIINK